MFDRNKFVNTKFSARTESVRVEDLAQWFGDDEPVWIVRGLTFEELAKADASAESRQSVQKILTGLASRDGQKISEEIKNHFGFGEDTPAIMVKRINYLVAGSVEPECDEELAVKLASTYPIEFRQLTDRVLLLTGKGFEPGKPTGSGTTTKSKAR